MQYKKIIKLEKPNCGCPTWLDHWVRATKSRKLPVCSVYKCANKAVVGGHINACDIENNEWLIMPLCSNHNSLSKTECFDVKVSVARRLVLAKPNVECRHYTKIHRRKITN